MAVNDDDSGGEKRLKSLLREAVRDELSEGFNARYVECPGCRDALTKENAAKRGCVPCGLTLKDGRWQKTESAKPVKKDILGDVLREFGL